MQTFQTLVEILLVSFYAAIILSIWYSVFFTFAELRKNKHIDDFLKVASFREKFSILFGFSTLFWLFIILFVFRLALCLGYDSKFFYYVLKVLIKHQSTCLFNLSFYGLMSVFLGAVLFKLKKLIGWRFFLSVFILALIMLLVGIGLYKYDYSFKNLIF